MITYFVMKLTLFLFGYLFCKNENLLGYHFFTEMKIYLHFCEKICEAKILSKFFYVVN